ncbi:hypothetical protein E4U15_006474 [Claviceps sp. LM218 group G6]|nr:hypothetical protein E4U15_006474 [Claviceps sp. LM218 group G6]
MKVSSRIRLAWCINFAPILRGFQNMGADMTRDGLVQELREKSQYHCAKWQIRRRFYLDRVAVSFRRRRCAFGIVMQRFRLEKEMITKNYPANHGRSQVGWFSGMSTNTEQSGDSREYV